VIAAGIGPTQRRLIRLGHGAAVGSECRVGVLANLATHGTPRQNDGGRTPAGSTGRHVGDKLSSPAVPDCRTAAGVVNTTTQVV